MGMDGGLEILQLRSAEACSELRELLDPWLDEITDIRRGKYGRDSRSLWVKENGAVYPHSIMSSYGDDVEDSGPVISDLRKWVEYLELRNFGVDTWDDLFTDLLTRPDFDANGKYQGETTDLERLWVLILQHDQPKVKSIAEWVKAVRQCLRGSSYHTVETWT